MFPGMAVSIIVMVRKVPLIPTNASLLKQIVGYAKHLASDSYQVQEKDLPWTLGLGVHADIIAKTFHYAEDNLPEWLHSTETDIPLQMKRMHQTFGQQVGEALYGEMESDNNLGRSNMGDRY